ncbi:ankyrin repeat protein [Lactarius hatsudake]|nr:ankyrin repeat protein [Lactarius hatsudake]
MKGRRDVVECLLDHGADVNLQDDFQNTPLTLAARCWHMDVVQVLLEHGADVHSRDRLGQTPLHDVIWGASSRHNLKGDAPQIVRLLLEHGADIGAEDNDGKTPLQMALADGLGDSEIARLLSEFRSGRAQT